jgi:hypothetical protein
LQFLGQVLPMSDSSVSEPGDSDSDYQPSGNEEDKDIHNGVVATSEEPFCIQLPLPYM